MHLDNETILTARGEMPDLEYIFHPKSIALVGASTKPSNSFNYFFLDSLMQFGYEGDIYPIHPTASEISGFKAYPSISDIPGTIDHVTCGIKADLTPNLMRECVAKRVKLVHFFTSGFGETGEEKGTRLEKEIVEIARQGNMRVMGPNCMGIYCPNSKISFEPSFPKKSGNVGFLAQSGGNSIEGVQLSGAKGVYFSKVVSFGNASDINASDLLAYFTNDPQTKTIASYIEGIQDGRRFANALREASIAKPVIVLKGGIGKAGSEAVASHTGSLAGSNVVWDSLFRQLGIIQVHELEELIDLLLLFQHFKPLKSRRAGLIGTGGGRSVLATDSCEKEGLIVPPLPQDVRKELRNLVPQELYPGTIVRNPVDPGGLDWDPDIFPRILKTVANYDGVDFILAYTRATIGANKVSEMINSISKAKHYINKPIAILVRHNEEPKTTSYALEMQAKCLKAGIPAFSSFSRAARALNNFISYHETRQSLAKEDLNGRPGIYFSPRVNSNNRSLAQSS